MRHELLSTIKESIKGINLHWLYSFSPGDHNRCFANSVDPDETVRYEPSHQDLHCLPFCFCFKTETSFCISVHIQIRGWESPLQKLMDVRVRAKHSVRKIYIISYPFMIDSYSVR